MVEGGGFNDGRGECPLSFGVPDSFVTIPA